MLNIDLPLAECLALGFDLGLFLLCRAILRRHLEILKDIREAPRFDGYADLTAHLSNRYDVVENSHPDSSALPSPAPLNEPSIQYAVLEGRIEPIDSPIASQFVSSEYGVVKSFTITDHKVERRHGLWQERSESIQTSSRDVPFKIVLSQDATLQSAGLLRAALKGVEFRDLDKLDNPLLGELDVVYDKFQPSSTGFGKALMDNFRGDVSKGIQETEKMLLVGTKVTAIGKVLMKGGGNGIKMVYPAKDLEFILTKKTYEEIVDGYQNATGVIRVITYILGATGVFLVGLIGTRVYKEIKERGQYASLLRQLSEHRRANVSPSRDPNTVNDFTDSGTQNVTSSAGVEREAASTPVADCIVCMTNVRDVILLTCGHVCVCAECAAMLPSNRCPVCRSQIDRVQPFFIA